MSVDEPDASPSPYVSWRREGSVWTITIDRPAQRNALSSDMYLALKQGVRLGSAVKSISVIVLRGASGAFAVGGDLEPFLEMVKGGPEHFRKKFEATYEDPLPFGALLHSTKPVVAAIDGFCVAGGLLIAMCCDLTIASERSLFGIPEARVGLADVATTELLVPSIGLMRTRYLSMTGKMISAEIAERWGLITRCVPVDEFEEAVAAAVSDLQRASPTAQRAYKSMLNSHIGPTANEALTEVALSADGLEGLSAFNEKRTPVWPSLG